MSLEPLTCPQCGRTFDNGECWVWHTSDPEMYHDGDQLPLIHCEVLEYPCGHSRELPDSAEPRQLSDREIDLARRIELIESDKIQENHNHCN